MRFQHHLWCAALYLAISQIVSAKEVATEEFIPCAKDPAHQFIETLQRNAYDGDEVALRLLRRNQRTAVERMKAQLRRESERPNATGAPQLGGAQFDKWFLAELAKVRVPTCYEDPTAYLIIKKGVEDIDRARRELGYQSDYQPKIGTAPTESVNALTYYDEATKEHVILINTELLRFSGQIASLTVQTIPLDRLREPQRVISARGRDIVVDFESHPEWGVDAVSAGLILLHVPTPELSELDTRYDEFAVPFGRSIDLFVIGHEYGHVINKDRPFLVSKAQRSAGDAHADLAVWTWPHELSADKIGVTLFERALERDVRLKGLPAELAPYALRAPLLFMVCLEIVDDSAFVKQHGTLPPKRTAHDEAVMRDFADGKLSVADASRELGGPLGDYPPPWLREERLQAAISDLGRRLPVTPQSTVNGDLAKALISRMHIYWAMARRSLVARYREASSSKGSH